MAWRSGRGKIRAWTRIVAAGEDELWLRAFAESRVDAVEWQPEATPLQHVGVAQPTRAETAAPHVDP
ncbi:MAG: hypothetical protein J2P22_01605 [Nocardioides sp.]|nr:hypothetical protein [Nocardioides sp.]